MRVGEVEIVPLLDAVGKLGELAELYPDVPAEAWDPYRELYPTQFEDSRWRFNVSVQLVRVDGQTILVDTGYGPSGWWKHWAPERDGLLPGALEEVGVGREDVDVVFLTHLHVDHIGWNTDKDGAPFFPRARYVVHPDGLAYALEKSDRPQVQRCIVPLAERFEWPGDDAELAPGVAVRVLPGHYPGHAGVSVRSGGERAELIADSAPHPALLDRPEWRFAFDEIPQTTTRGALIEDVVDIDCLLVCGHYPGSGIGRVATRGDHVVWGEVV